jgi:hypothetical protein
MPAKSRKRKRSKSKKPAKPANYQSKRRSDRLRAKENEMVDLDKARNEYSKHKEMIRQLIQNPSQRQALTTKVYQFRNHQAKDKESVSHVKAVKFEEAKSEESDDEWKYKSAFDSSNDEDNPPADNAPIIEQTNQKGEDNEEEIIDTSNKKKQRKPGIQKQPNKAKYFRRISIYKPVRSKSTVYKVSDDQKLEAKYSDTHSEVVVGSATYNGRSRMDSTSARLHLNSLFRNGYSAYKIVSGKLSTVSPKKIYELGDKFSNMELESSSPSTRGRKSKIGEMERKALVTIVDEKEGLVTIEQIRKIMKNKYKAKLSVGLVHKTLGTLGYIYGTPRTMVKSNNEIKSNRVKW